MEFVETQLNGNLLVDLLETTNNKKEKNETKEIKKTVKMVKLNIQ